MDTPEGMEEELDAAMGPILVSIEPPPPATECWLCSHESTNAAGAKVAAEIGDIIVHGVARRSDEAVARSVREYLDVYRDGHAPGWTVACIEDHIRYHHSDPAIVSARDERTLALVLENCRQHLIEDETGRVHAPTLTLYLKTQKARGKPAAQTRAGR